ncbi:hypothetical protein V8C42DRAFT_343570 [Trichoderma barbatum]
MSAMEGLLSQENYKARRTVIFAFGFDEEFSGLRGASSISEHLEDRYGKDGIAVILDEGGAGLQRVGDTLYALPAVYEKGIMSKIVVALESNPFEPKIIQDGPNHEALICFTRYSPNAIPPLTDFIITGQLDKAAQLKRSYITRQTLTHGDVWDIFAGTVRHTFAGQAKTVVPAQRAMTGNTDTRHYLGKILYVQDTITWRMES